MTQFHDLSRPAVHTPAKLRNCEARRSHVARSYVGGSELRNRLGRCGGLAVLFERASSIWTPVGSYRVDDDRATAHGRPHRLTWRQEFTSNLRRRTDPMSMRALITTVVVGFREHLIKLRANNRRAAVRRGDALGFTLFSLYVREIG